MERKGLTAGIAYYTDCRCPEPIFSAVINQLKRAAGDRDIVSVSLGQSVPLGDNIILNLERSYLTMFRQQLMAISELDTDFVFMCFPRNTYVETINGLRRIEEIKRGEMVKTHRGRYRPVTRVFKRHYKQRSPLIEISTAHSSVKCTPEHPFYVSRNGIPEWLPASKISPGDRWLYPSDSGRDYLEFNIALKSSPHSGRFGSTDRYISSIEITPDFARFMGMYLAEGHFNGKNGIGFTFNNNEQDYHEFIKRVCLKTFGRVARKRRQWATQILINIHALGPLFKAWFGANAHSKRIPAFVFKWTLRNRLAFIRGVLEGDGTYHKRGRFFVSLASVSRRMIDDMCRLMNESGVGWRGKVATYQNKGFGNGGDCHTIIWSKKTHSKMLDLLAAEDGPPGYLGVPITKTSAKAMRLVALYENKVRTGYSDYVYNLEVADDNSYIVQSGVVHNCEHDVLYDSSHFQFVPPRDDLIYYNYNVWRLRADTGESLFHYHKSVSQLCANHRLLIDHYRERIARVEAEGFKYRMGFEPGTRKLSHGGIDDLRSETWMSPVPNIDIHTGKNLTRLMWEKSDFRNQKFTAGWTKGSGVPGWPGKSLGRFNDWLAEIGSPVVE